MPTSEVDEFWHQHILNTWQYASDCQKLTGGFVHHFPSSGIICRNESAELTDKFFDTWLSYETIFNEPYEETIGAALLPRTFDRGCATGGGTPQRSAACG